MHVPMSLDTCTVLGTIALTFSWGEQGEKIACLSSSGAALLGTADDKRGSRVREIHAT